MENAPIEILYQDENIIVVHKPSGLLVHPYWKETNERENLMATVRDQIGQKVYPIHRLDRPVSGAMMFGLNGDIVKRIQEFWHDKTLVHKEYLALVYGDIEAAGKYDFALSDANKIKKDALTKYRPLSRADRSTLVQVVIETGRTHQIRRHFSRSHHHLIGDTKHGKGNINRFYRDEYDFHRIFLHSYRFKINLEFLKIDVTCPLPKELSGLLDRLNMDYSNIPNWEDV
ncbi:RluA family pseudouridine synthase [Halobacteriovorax sp. HLS]|uniref:RluA family pseudouridine synthase n=1 Tax=Halobacteriovorax sp. HLS TaxID=2234000 RepID=UPI000FDB76B8|nr:pseudouridine synthase [Halobacteriovorax sp. HLS]